MDIKVAAFTVNEKSIYTLKQLSESVAKIMSQKRVPQNSIYQIEKKKYGLLNGTASRQY